ncbi:MAG: hypothetical protein J3K34DRAFT_409497 [Monoraphidium minutum]|nr:MAG: hypothetical protein J3K34DRAFT_409497 [Monoraphidium minutum]
MAASSRRLARPPLFNRRCGKLPRPICLKSPYTASVPLRAPHLECPQPPFTQNPQAHKQHASAGGVHTPGRSNTAAALDLSRAWQSSPTQARQGSAPPHPCRAHLSPRRPAQAISTAFCSLLPPTRQLWQACPRAKLQPLLFDPPENVFFFARAHSTTT